MPAHPCPHPTCDNYVGTKGNYCTEHSRLPKVAMTKQAAKKFYDSVGWKRARRLKLSVTPWCERCLKVFAVQVHHKIPLRDCSISERLAQANLRALCIPCHNEEDHRTG